MSDRHIDVDRALKLQAGSVLALEVLRLREENAALSSLLRKSARNTVAFRQWWRQVFRKHTQLRAEVRQLRGELDECRQHATTGGPRPPVTPSQYWTNGTSTSPATAEDGSAPPLRTDQGSDAHLPRGDDRWSGRS